MNQSFDDAAKQPAIDSQILDAALQHLASGEVESAAELSQILMRQNPNDFQALQLAASIALEQHHLQDANKLFKLSLQHASTKPAQASAWHGLASTLREARDYRQSEEAYRRATLLDPAVASHWTEYGRTLALQGKLDAAMDVFCIAIQRDSRDPVPCGLLGNTLMQLKRYEDAAVFYRQALDRQPDDAASLHNLGTTLQILGQLDEARNAYEKACQIDPGMTSFSALAQVKTFAAGDPQIPLMQARAVDAALSIDTRIDAGFGLAKAFDDLGDYDEAFTYLVTANRAKRTTLEYSIETEIAKIEQLMTVFDQNLFRRLGNKSDATLAPIFIVSMPRSGSTLLEQMLAGHTDVIAGGELGDMKDAVLELNKAWGSPQQMTGKSDAALIEEINHAAALYVHSTHSLQRVGKCFTDKNPQNAQYIGYIRLFFPHASIINVTRDAMDTCFSCYSHLFSSPILYSYDLRELGQYYKLYQKLMAHWHATSPDQILDVRYEALVENPEQSLREVMDFCGLEYQASCLDFTAVKRPVTTASSAQVRKPLYKTSVQSWKRYEKHLGPLLAALKD